MSTNNYQQHLYRENTLKLRQLIKELPSFCHDFFIAMEPLTTIKTRIAYAYDYKIFFEYLMNDGIIQREKVSSIEPEDLDTILPEYIEKYLDHLSYYKTPSDLIERIAYRYSSPGIGKEVGSYAASYLPFYQGLFMAPHVVGQAIKGAILYSAVFKDLGYEVNPQPNEERCDIIQSIKFPTAKQLISFCQGIQKGSPIDSYVQPEPWDMPGYDHKVIMAAGTFIQGASIELSADAPIKPPYIAYVQGGLTYEHAKIGLATALQTIQK
jgi:hypothetical protein